VQRSNGHRDGVDAVADERHRRAGDQEAEAAGAQRSGEPHGVFPSSGAAGSGGGAGVAAWRASPALAVGVRPLCSHEPDKPAMPIIAMMASLRSLMVVFLSRG